MDHCKKKLKQALSLAAKDYAIWAESVDQSTHGCKVSSKDRAAVFRQSLRESMMRQDQEFVVDLLLDLIYDSELASEQIYSICDTVRKERKA